MTTAPLLFYGVPEGCSFGSIVALEWIGQPYRLCRVPMPEVVASDAFRHINPVGETPTLLTSDGRLLSESMAILHHLGARATDAGLWGAPGTAELDHAMQALAFLNTTLFNAFSPLWFALERAIDGSAKQALADYGRRSVVRAHEALEDLLADRAWLAGPHRTLADGYFAGIARWNDLHRVVDRAQYPRVDRLYRRLLDDPAVRFAHAVEHEEPLPESRAFRGHVSLDDALRQLHP